MMRSSQALWRLSCSARLPSSTSLRPCLWPSRQQQPTSSTMRYRGARPSYQLQPCRFPLHHYEIGIQHSPKQNCMLFRVRSRQSRPNAWWTHMLPGTSAFRQHALEPPSLHAGSNRIFPGCVGQVEEVQQLPVQHPQRHTQPGRAEHAW